MCRLLFPKREPRIGGFAAPRDRPSLALRGASPDRRAANPPVGDEAPCAARLATAACIDHRPCHRARWRFVPCLPGETSRASCAREGPRPGPGPGLGPLLVHRRHGFEPGSYLHRIGFCPRHSGRCLAAMDESVSTLMHLWSTRILTADGLAAKKPARRALEAASSAAAEASGRSCHRLGATWEPLGMSQTLPPSPPLFPRGTCAMAAAKGKAKTWCP